MLSGPKLQVYKIKILNFRNNYSKFEAMLNKTDWGWELKDIVMSSGNTSSKYRIILSQYVLKIYRQIHYGGKENLGVEQRDEKISKKKMQMF